ncbi:hypothetical protein [Streptomyces sp. NPDC054838]
MSHANRGAEVKNAVIELWVTGPLTLRRPPESGTFSGFTCAASGPAGFRCTGGTVMAAETNQIPYRATVARAGNGTIHASITGAGDAGTADNSSSFAVQAVPKTG